MANQRAGHDAHVLIADPRRPQVEHAFGQAQQKLSGETEIGRTAHVVVYSDGTATGNAAAQAILRSAEADFSAVQGYFGGLQLPPGQPGDDQSTVRTQLPLHVAIDPQAGGAYHFSCAGTDLFVEPDPVMASGLFVAELVEVFEAAINNGWDCGRYNGEALSRVLAVERNASLAAITVQTAQSWWADGHADYVTTNGTSDTDADANGCNSLFLYYLHSQLGYSWQQIVQAGASDLGGTYNKLTGNNPAQGVQDFLARLATIAQGGQLSMPASGNPFPIQGTRAVPRGASGNGGGATSGGGGAFSAGGGGPSGGVIGVLVALIIVLAAAIIGILTGVIPLFH